MKRKKKLWRQYISTLSDHYCDLTVNPGGCSVHFPRIISCAAALSHHVNAYAAAWRLGTDRLSSSDICLVDNEHVPIIRSTCLGGPRCGISLLAWPIRVFRFTNSVTPPGYLRIHTRPAYQSPGLGNTVRYSLPCGNTESLGSGPMCSSRLRP